LENIICIDESSFSILMKRNYCYSQKGKRCAIKTSSQEVFKKYTGIFAINSNIYKNIIKGTYKRNSKEKYIKKSSSKKNSKNKKIYK
jgi:hypothetical protein